MTRINLVRPEDLADQHLFAEWREIKMIPAKIKKLWGEIKEIPDAQIRSSKLHYFEDVFLKDIPDTYRMSAGHVRFFYNKTLFLYDRYILLTQELHNRKFNIASHDARALFFDGIPYVTRVIEWKPTSAEVIINIERIEERLKEKPNWYRYHGEIKPPEFFTDRYRGQLMVDAIIG